MSIKALLEMYQNTDNVEMQENILKELWERATTLNNLSSDTLDNQKVKK